MVYKLADKAWKIQNATPIETSPKMLGSGPLYGLIELFATASKNLKYPAFVLNLPDDGTSMNAGFAATVIRLTRAGPKAKHPGSINVVRKNDDTFLGRIHVDGTFEEAPWLDQKVVLKSQLLMRLNGMATAPASTAASYGKLTGKCCFCASELSDPKSTAIGYGKKCAQHYGLPYATPPAQKLESLGVSIADVGNAVKHSQATLKALAEVMGVPQEQLMPGSAGGSFKQHTPNVQQLQKAKKGFIQPMNVLVEMEKTVPEAKLITLTDDDPDLPEGPGETFVWGGTTWVTLHKTLGPMHSLKQMFLAIPESAYDASDVVDAAERDAVEEIAEELAEVLSQVTLDSVPTGHTLSLLLGVTADAGKG